MLRLRVAVLLSLLLVGVSRAQTPGEEFELPQPTPVVLDTVSESVEEAPPASTDMACPPILLERVASDGWRFWAKADYAVAFIKAKPLPALATTSPPGTAQAAAGVLGLSGTSDLIGNMPISAGPRSEGRLEFGWWFDPERTLGVGAGFFVTGSKGEAFTTASDGTTIIARPFTDATKGTPSSVLVAFPGVSSGSVNVFAAMETFWGANLDLQECFASGSWYRLESLIGYRYLHYGESLEMTQNLVATGGAFVPGTQIISGDSFRTINDFHGIEFGFRSEFFRERWSMEVLTKLAAGNIRRETLINGSTQTSVPGSTTTNAVGGVYALSSNIGNHFSDAWKVAPEFGLTVGYQVSSNVRLRVGYSFLILEGIARAADQIDFTVNQNLFPPAIPGGPNRPGFSTVRSDIWIQSVNLGVEFQF